MHEAGNDQGFWVHKVESMLDEWATHGQPTVLFWGLLKSVSDLYELDQKRPCVVCMKLFELNGLSGVEIDRLIHELKVLTRSHNYIKHNCVCRPLEMKL